MGEYTVNSCLWPVLPAATSSNVIRLSFTPADTRSQRKLLHGRNSVDILEAIGGGLSMHISADCSAVHADLMTAQPLYPLPNKDGRDKGWVHPDVRPPVGVVRSL